MRSAWIGQLVAESLGGGIDSRKEIDLWLLQFYLTHSLRVKGVHTFSKGIRPEVNVIALLEFELAYCDVVVQLTIQLHRQSAPSTETILTL